MASAPSPVVRGFLAHKLRTLLARAHRLSRLTPQAVGLRAQDRPFAPSPEHFESANRRLADIDRDLARRIDFLRRHWRSASADQTLLYMALVEREIDRARRAFGMFFEVFGQRGSRFAPALAAYDAIAADCYAAVRRAAPLVFRGPLVKPLTYMEHGYSPSTQRRGVTLSRLLGERNPFPVIRVPWDRDNPWQSVFLHEVAHNLQADLGLWEENRLALARRLARESGDATVHAVYGRWHKEIFADLAALLLGGPAACWGLMDFLAHPAPKTLTYKPGGMHPTGLLRVPILGEMLRRMGFAEDAAQVRRVWTGLYGARTRSRRSHRLPPALLTNTDATIAAVVDEIAYQTRRGLAQRALADVIPFTHDDERRIRDGGHLLARGLVPGGLPPRLLVSASRYALQSGAPAAGLSRTVIGHLTRPGAVSHLSRPLALAA